MQVKIGCKNKKRDLQKRQGLNQNSRHNELPNSEREQELHWNLLLQVSHLSLSLVHLLLLKLLLALKFFLGLELLLLLLQHGIPLSLGLLCLLRLLRLLRLLLRCISSIPKLNNQTK